MKNISQILLPLLVVAAIFASCSKSKTYAERLADERKAISGFIKRQKIKVIDFKTFVAQDSVTNLEDNEYVELQNKVYLQIVDKGSENLVDTFENGAKLTVRYVEHNIKGNYNTGLSNSIEPNVDAFNYRIYGDQVSGEFYGPGMMISNGIAKVPAGWLIAMRFVRKGARLRLIVPSKMGHTYAYQNVAPFHYDLRKIAEANPME